MKQEIFGIKAPKAGHTITDKKDPFYGEINVKKEFIKGKVIKKDTNRSATIEWMRPFYVPKYERYEIRRSRLHVHNPESVHAEIGEWVLVARCRPLSKTKHHIILQVVAKDEQTKKVGQ